MRLGHAVMHHIAANSDGALAHLMSSRSSLIHMCPSFTFRDVWTIRKGEHAEKLLTHSAFLTKEKLQPQWELGQVSCFQSPTPVTSYKLLTPTTAVPATAPRRKVLPQQVLD